MPHERIIIDSKKDADHFTTALMHAMDVGAKADVQTFPPEKQAAVDAAMANLETVVGGTCSVLEGMTSDVNAATQGVKDAMA